MVTRNPTRTGAGSGADPDGREAAAPRTDPKGNWLQAFQDGATEYMAALAQTSARLQEKQRVALEALHLAAPEATQSSFNEEVGNAYRDLIDAIQKQDLEKIKSIQANHLKRMQTVYSEAETTQRNRQTEYLNALQTAWQATRTEIEAAFQRYLDAMKNNFAKLPSDVDPAAIAVIGQSLAMIAGYAQCAVQAAPPAPGGSP